MASNGILLKNKEEAATTNGSKKPFRVKVVWFNALGFLALHIMGTYGVWVAIFHGYFATYIWALTLVAFTGLTLTIGTHRLICHRSYTALRGLKLLLIAFHTMAGQNCLYIWARDHRQHHKFSDTDADPHNSRRGFFFSHVGWLLVRKHPDVIEKGKYIDLSDLEDDLLVMIERKYYVLSYMIFALGIPVLVPIAAWGESLWNSVMVAFFMRYVFILNVTWLVNSAAHWCGTRPYNKHIDPRQSDIIGLITFGEGWHNYHHCFPWDYKASELRNQGLNTQVLNLLELFGLTYDIKEATPRMIRDKVQKGDGSHFLWGLGDMDMDKKILQQLNQMKDKPQYFTE